MNDVTRNKFALLIDQVETLEEQVSLLQQNLPADGTTPALEKELDEKQQQLAAKRTELARVSDGCGPGHPKP